ncbi:hypothetical protein E7744_15515 (plasmid) [Citricoccus sp. SGAir0253]|uniref:universal stress protein n=1 Tax=Citricoccus sp. SGAir0253 TaxID=2567881 RepID=UPI0010CD59CB|nr:universal stress protein [Citricoccus sp. SGAir0253]QCU79717.1 hypothetical protein E7744_15515 [Citricoccus sp. SGAir0253]
MCSGSRNQRTCPGRRGRRVPRAGAETDLLLVGSGGLGGFTGLLLESVSTPWVHRSPCAVLVVQTRRGTRE